MSSVTRIDRALRQAQREFFTTANGGRQNIPKIIIMLTDGLQKQRKGVENPSEIAKEIRKDGIHTIVVGIGSGIVQDHTKLITPLPIPPPFY